MDKIMKKIIFLIVTVFLMLGFAPCVIAGDVNVDLTFTYNGFEATDTLGFKLHQVDPAGVDTVVADITGGDTRAWNGVIDAPVGRSEYYLTAYSASAESDGSNSVPFEYMEPTTPGLPAPTIIIKFS